MSSRDGRVGRARQLGGGGAAPVDPGKIRRIVTRLGRVPRAEVHGTTTAYRDAPCRCEACRSVKAVADKPRKRGRARRPLSEKQQRQIARRAEYLAQTGKIG